jgi:hypothetical protein
MGRPSRWLIRLLFILAVVAATSPGWRALLLDADPTLDELLMLRCLGGARP